MNRTFTKVAAFIITACLLLCIAVPALAETVEGESYTVTADTGYLKLGDVNGSGIITAADARTALRAAADIERPRLTYYQTVAADVNFDGAVTASDARIILRAAAKLTYIVDPSDIADPTSDIERPIVTTTVPEITTEFYEGELPIISAGSVRKDTLTKYYAKGTLEEADGTVTAFEIATDGYSTYVRAPYNSHDVGMLFKNAGRLTDGGYIINYENNSYLYANKALILLFDYSMVDYITSAKLNVAEYSFMSVINPVTIKGSDGTKLIAIAVKNTDGTSEKLYFPVGSSIPCIAEKYASDGSFISRMTLEAVSDNPTEYLKLPAGLTRISFVLSGSTKVGDFLEALDLD